MDVTQDQRRDELEQNVSDAVAELLEYTGAAGLIAPLSEGRILAIGRADDIRESLKSESLTHHQPRAYCLVLDPVVLETDGNVADMH